MMLTRLELRRFKRFDDLGLQLTPGINVIKGPNESGKSSLIQAFLASLFWKATSTKREVSEWRSWGTDEGFILCLEGQEEGESWSLTKDFAARTSLLRYRGEETTDANRINEKLGDWLGLATEELYCSTAGIRQEEIQDISSGRRQLAESLQRTIAGGGASAPGALKELKGILDDLNRGRTSPAKRPGLIAAAQAELNRLEDEYAKASERSERTREATGEIARITESCQDLRQEADALDRVIEESRERLQLEEELERLRGDFDRADRESRLLDECAELEQQAARFDLVSRVLEHGEMLDTLKQQGAGLQATRAGLEVELDRYKSELTRVPAWERVALALVILLAAAGVAGLFFSVWAVLALGLAIAAAVGVTVRRLILRRSRQQAGAHLLQRIDELGAEAHRVETQLQGLAHAAGCATVQDLWNLGAEYRAFDALREANHRAMEALGIRPGEVGRQTEVDDLATGIASRQARLTVLAPTSLEGVELRKAELRRESVAGELERLEAERIRLSVVTDSADEEEILRLEEEMAEAGERLEARQRQARVYEIATELIGEAARSTTVSVAEVLKSEIGKHISVITGGKYRQVEVDPETLTMQVRSEEKRGMVDAGELSRGTIDQLYLVARLSLMRNIAGGRRPPLLLDDSFVTFDRDRLNRAMRLVRAFSRDYQVLLFTCYDTFDSFADNLVNLEQISRVRRLEL